MVCCIDETHKLLKNISDNKEETETYFVLWRRQILEIEWKGFFDILLSTNAKVDNFVPRQLKTLYPLGTINLNYFLMSIL